MQVSIQKLVKYSAVLFGLYFLQVQSAAAKEGFTICNQTAENVDIAFGYHHSGNWKSKGWYNVAKYSCKDINWTLTNSHYYIHGRGVNGSRWGANYMFCTHPKNAFSVTGDKNCSNIGHTKTGFNQIKIESGVEHFTYTLTNNSKPSTASYRKIDGLDIGDGVYVQGFFSDELVYVVRKDRASNTVKVRRGYDGTTTWVSVNKIITRQQSTMNDVGRTAVAFVAIACLFSPQNCKG